MIGILSKKFIIPDFPEFCDEIREIYDEVKNKLASAYKQLKIGNPLNEENHVGPLIDKDAVKMYLSAIERAKKDGATVLVEGGVLKGSGYESGCYVQPVIIEAENQYSIVQEETFAPILYLMQYSKLEEAIEMQNNVKQGLSSGIMTI